MKKTLTIPKDTKSNISTTIGENITKLKSKIKNMKANFKKKKLELNNTLKTQQNKNNYVPFSNEIAFKIGDLGFDEYGNLVKW